MDKETALEYLTHAKQFFNDAELHGIAISMFKKLIESNGLVEDKEFEQGCVEFTLNEEHPYFKLEYQSRQNVNKSTIKFLVPVVKETFDSCMRMFMANIERVIHCQKTKDFPSYYQ